MASAKVRLELEVETLFLTPANEWLSDSTKLLIEVVGTGGDISGFVSPEVTQYIVGRADPPALFGSPGWSKSWRG